MENLKSRCARKPARDPAIAALRLDHGCHQTPPFCPPKVMSVPDGCIIRSPRVKTCSGCVCSPQSLFELGSFVFTWEKDWEGGSPRQYAPPNEVRRQILVPLANQASTCDAWNSKFAFALLQRLYMSEINLQAITSPKSRLWFCHMDKSDRRSLCLLLFTRTLRKGF